ncbi:MAG: glycosyltransferase [Pirellulales bacterium]|nr:glycosyltransferase [Pirellulales bacterium]
MSNDGSARVRLSVAMLVRDEEAALAESIESVRAIADEIVVLDTGSTDATPRVAQSLGARVARSNWNDDFAAARNLLARQTRGDWILWLDAGERLDAESSSALRACVDGGLDPARVYMMQVVSPPPAPGASAERIVQARLMPRRPELQFEGRLRETVAASMEQLDMVLDTAPGVIHRPARQHDIEYRRGRARRNLRIVTAAQAAGPLSPGLLIAQGEAFADLDQLACAREAFFAAIETSPHGSTEMLEAYYGLLTTYVGDSAGHPQQMAACLEALEVFPLDAQLHLAMGNSLQSRGRLDLAVRSFRAAFELGQVNLDVWHLVELAEVASSCLSLTLQLQGADEDAAEVLRQAMTQWPHSARLRRHAIDLCVKRGQVEEALRIAESSGVAPERLGPLCEAIRGACRAAAQEHEAALAPLRAAYAAGCREPVCLRWLAAALLSTGQTDEAGPIVRQWCALEPGNAEAQAYLAACGGPPPSAPPAEPAPAELATAEIAAATPGRWHRIDSAVTVLEIGPPGWPIVTQATTADDPAGA